MKFLYLTLIPNLILIVLLLFNKNAHKKYKVKKAVIHLLTMFVSIVIFISFNVYSHYRHPVQNTSIDIYMIFLICSVLLVPFSVLSMYRINGKNNIRNKKWFRVLFGIAMGIFFILILYFMSYKI